MKSGDNLYNASQVRVARELPEHETDPESNPYRAPEISEIPNAAAQSSSKIRVLPLLAFVLVGLTLGQYFISPQMLPRSIHVLQQFRSAAMGGLMGVLLYAMMEFLLARKDKR